MELNSFYSYLSNFDLDGLNEAEVRMIRFICVFKKALQKQNVFLFISKEHTRRQRGRHRRRSFSVRQSDGGNDNSVSTGRT